MPQAITRLSNQANLRTKLYFPFAGRPVFVSFLALGLTCVFAYVSVRAYRRSAPKTNGLIAQEQQKSQAIGGISINLTRFGFEPSQITIPEGKFYIHIKNLTQTEAPVYSLYKNKTEKLQENRLKKEQVGLEQDTRPEGRRLFHTGKQSP